ASRRAESAPGNSSYPSGAVLLVVRAVRHRPETLPQPLGLVQKKGGQAARFLSGQLDHPIVLGAQSPDVNRETRALGVAHDEDLSAAFVHDLHGILHAL